MTRSRKPLLGAAIASAACTIGVLAPHAAAAEPEDAALVDTTCTAAQVEAALHDQAPRAAQRLDQHPIVKAGVEHFLSLPPDVRVQKAERFRAHHPQAREHFQQRHPNVDLDKAHAKAQQLADTCANY